MSGMYAIEGTTLTGIASAVRGLVNEDARLTPAQIESKIRAFSREVASRIDFSGAWRRPEGWPNLDEIQMDDDFDGLYLTYDLSRMSGCAWIGVYVETAEANKTYVVERGTLDGEGRFTATFSSTLNSRGYFRQALEPEDGMIQLWRVRSDSGISVFGFVANTDTTAENFLNTLQPCVERAGRLSHATMLNTTNASNVPTQRAFGTAWLERDAVKIGGDSRVTTLNRCWQNCYSLVSLDLSGWDTENWPVTNLAGCWSNCYLLPSLDVSGWKTGGWTVTTMADTWQNNCSLRALDLSGWDTRGWAVTSMADCWQNCYNLRALDLSMWKTDNWNVSNMANVWTGCYSMGTLNLDGWNTSGWHVTSFSSCWQYCCSLQSLDLSGWDISNWSPTSINNCWYNCMCLRELYGPENWGFIANMSNSGMNNCYSLRSFRGMPCSVTHSYGNSNLLSRDSLLAILDVVPEITVARTLTLGINNRKKLTDEEIAVATQKGWTVA